ncbi:hypothetical protein [Pseudomonas huanghezhanensis]|uniref:hypothetical protein n=1 Tax=Pseudomonas huanghezhanensis TaxID=3002903 RepID=UPI0022869C35|nr:hypothetical protein [Pseudomonas sp. BSw22131]
MKIVTSVTALSVAFAACSSVSASQIQAPAGQQPSSHVINVSPPLLQLAGNGGGDGGGRD